jgi:hypothetical protein
VAAEGQAQQRGRRGAGRVVAQGAQQQQAVVGDVPVDVGRAVVPEGVAKCRHRDVRRGPPGGVAGQVLLLVRPLVAVLPTPGYSR